MVLGHSWRNEARRKSFEHLREFLEFDRLDLLSLIEPYHNFKKGIGKNGPHETCS